MSNKKRRGKRRSTPSVDQLEGRNIVIEVLKRNKRSVRKIMIDSRAKRDGKVEQIISMATRKKIPLFDVPRQDLDEMSQTGVHNGVIALADPHPSYSTSGLLDATYAKDQHPFLVLVDELNYEQNLGAIMRSSMGAGVHGVIVPEVRGKGLTPVVQRVAMGGAEEVPLVREGLFSAIKQIKKAGITIVGADMDGVPIWDVPLTGAVAFVFGGESKGVSPTLRNKCDIIASVPLNQNLESLNVSVTAGVFLFEKNRQDREQ